MAERLDITGAVLREVGGGFHIGPLELDTPRADEVLVRIRAVGVCHTDLAVAHGHFPMRLPMVLGHEGSGVIEAVGAEVRNLKVGDPVVLSYSTCGACPKCEGDIAVYCEHFGQMNFGGRRPDGSETIWDTNGPVSGRFFGQSSFASHALVRAHDVVKAPSDAPLEMLGPLGCGFQTGAGTVLNVLKPAPDATLAVTGTGAVGLAAIMAAKALGCRRIIAVDRVESRLALARELGATETIDTSAGDLQAAFKALGGLDYVVETTGAPAIIEAAVSTLRQPGVCALHGAGANTKLEFDVHWLLGGRTVIGVREGHADPQTFIPRMIDLWREGKFPIERLIRYYPFAEIETALADAEAGRTIKPVLVF